MALALRANQGYNREEIVIERPDGSRLTVLAHANPVYDESGALAGAVNVLIDVTDRKRSEDAHALLAAIVASSDDAIVSKDLDGVIQSWNAGAERMFGYTREEAVGRSITLIIPPDRLDEEVEILSKIRRGERVDHYESVRAAKDGRLLDVSLTVSPVRDAAGRVVGASKVGRDVTERKRMEAALRRSDRAKDVFLATLAHELRNPLAPVRNAVQILQLVGSPTPEVRRAVEMIDRQVQQMTRLVDDLLDVGRIANNKLVLRRQRVDLAAVVWAAVETSRPLLDAGRHEFAAELPAGPVWLDADPTRLAQAVSNLMSNAAKYTESGGRVWLTAERQGSDAVVTVRDTGVGIPAEVLPGLFTLFAQEERSLERSQGGLGIGLALVKWLVELHGGSVEARSDGPGKGSAFTIRVPVLIEPPAASAGPGAAPAAAAAPLRVLVVDDNRDAADSLAVLLRLAGHDVRAVHDGLAGVAAAGEFRPEVVLLDIGLPRLNGYDAARRIRELPGGREVLLIAVTGWGQDGDRQRSKEAGFDHHLVKPVDPAALAQLLASFARPTADHRRATHPV